MTMIGTKTTFEVLLAAYDDGSKLFHDRILYPSGIKDALRQVSVDESEWACLSSSRAMSVFVVHASRGGVWSKDFSSLEEALEMHDDERRSQAVGDKLVILLDEAEFASQAVSDVAEKWKPRQTLVFHAPSAA